MNVLDKEGKPVGCAFLCGHCHAFTCTHVVANALHPAGVALGDLVTLQMPFLGDVSSSSPLQFIVEQAYPWSDEVVGSDSHARARRDICLLRLADGQVLPKSARPARSRLKSVREALKFRGFGLRRFDTPRGPVLRDYKLEGVVGIEGRNRWTVKSVDSDDAIKKGASGTGIYSIEEGLVGMVDMSQGVSSGWMIPIDVLAEIYPIATVANQSSPALSDQIRASGEKSHRAWRRAIAKLDRRNQAADFKFRFEKEWQSRKKSGFLCLVGGVREDLPIDCVHRFCAEYWRLEHGEAHEKLRPTPIEIEWPDGVSRYGPDYYLERLKNYLVDELRAESSSPEDIRSALTRLNRPTVLYSELDHGVIAEAEEDLIRDWVDYFGEICSEPLDQFLIHALLMEFDPSKPIAPLAKERTDYLIKRCAELSRRPEEQTFHAFEFLDEIDVKDIERWIDHTSNELARPVKAGESMKEDAIRDFRETSKFRFKRAKEWLDAAWVKRTNSDHAHSDEVMR